MSETLVIEQSRCFRLRRHCAASGNSHRYLPTRGHRLTPWRSPYLLWRIETYCGVKMQQIGFLEFWEFLWRERSNLWRFLRWTAEMERYVKPPNTKVS